MERGAAGFHVDHLSTQSSSGRGDEDISSTRRTDFCGMLLVEQGHPMAARSTAHRSDTHTPHFAVDAVRLKPSKTQVN